jgi:hypothetical protein
MSASAGLRTWPWRAGLAWAPAHVFPGVLLAMAISLALATIDSMQPRSELQALLAVQIIATGFAGLRFLRQSHRQMTEYYIRRLCHQAASASE